LPGRRAIAAARSGSLHIKASLLVDLEGDGDLDQNVQVDTGFQHGAGI
jgi:hypothetical protein